MFSNIHCENLVKLLELNLIILCGLLFDWDPLKFLTLRVAIAEPPMLHQLQFGCFSQQPALFSYRKSPSLTPAYIQVRVELAHQPHRTTLAAGLTHPGQPPTVTFSEIEVQMSWEVKAKPSALRPPLYLLPSPTPNLEIKFTKVSAWGGPAFTR